MNTVSVVIGIVAALLMLVGLIPFLGWLNWLVLVGCVAGVIFGALARRKPGLVINLVVGAVAALRLALGGGII